MIRQGFFATCCLAGVLTLAGCASQGGDYIAAADVQDVAVLGLANKLLAPNTSQLLTFGLAYLIYDPLAPNWEIEETRLSEDVFHLQLRMKRYATGGSGESMLILKRRAGMLQRELGFSSYRILDYQEGIESHTMAARRYGEGSIQLLRQPPAGS